MDCMNCGNSLLGELLIDGRECPFCGAEVVSFFDDEDEDDDEHDYPADCPLS